MGATVELLRGVVTRINEVRSEKLLKKCSAQRGFSVNRSHRFSCLSFSYAYDLGRAGCWRGLGRGTGPRQAGLSQIRMSQDPKPAFVEERQAEAPAAGRRGVEDEGLSAPAGSQGITSEVAGRPD